MTFLEELKQIEVNLDHFENIKEYCRIARKAGYSSVTVNRDNRIFLPNNPDYYDDILRVLRQQGLRIEEIYLTGSMHVRIYLV